MERQAKQTDAAVKDLGASLDKSGGSAMSRKMDDQTRAMHSQARATREVTTETRSEAREVDRSSQAHSRAIPNVRSHAREQEKLSSSMGKTNRESQGLARGLGVLGGALGGVARAAAVLKIPALAAGFAALVPAAAGAGAAIGALVPRITDLAGVLAALPAGVGALVQTLATVKLAFGGVGEALKAGTAAQEASGGAAKANADAQKQAANGVRSAERGIVMAQRGSRDAQIALTQARRDAIRSLTDQKLAAEGAGLGEQRAALSLRQAKQQLSQAQASGTGGLQLQDLRLGVKEAQLALRSSKVDNRRARTDNRRTQAKGVGGNEGVIQARRGVSDAAYAQVEATRALTDAQKAATESMSSGNTAADAYQKALAKLSPPARAFVKQLQGLKGEVKTLRASAAGGLFPGLMRAVDNGVRAFPMLNRVLAQTGKTLGNGAADITGGLTTKNRLGDIEEIAGTQDKVIGRALRAVGSLSRALVDLMVVAQPFVNWLSLGAARGARYVETTTAAGRATGSLGARIDRAKQALKLFWDIIKSTGGALAGLGHALRPLGDDLYESIDKGARRWDRWSNSFKGQVAMQSFFVQLEPVIYETVGLIGDLAKVLGRLAVDDSGLAFVKGLRRAVPDLEKTIVAVRDNLGPAFGDLALQALHLVQNLSGVTGPLTVLITALSTIARGVNVLLDRFPALKTVITGAISFVLLNRFISKIRGASTDVGGLAGAWGKVKAAMSSLPVIGRAFGQGPDMTPDGRPGRGVQRVYVVNMPAAGGLGGGGLPGEGGPGGLPGGAGSPGGGSLGRGRPSEPLAGGNRLTRGARGIGQRFRAGRAAAGGGLRGLAAGVGTTLLGGGARGTSAVARSSERRINRGLRRTAKYGFTEETQARATNMLNVRREAGRNPLTMAERVGTKTSALRTGLGALAAGGVGGAAKGGAGLLGKGLGLGLKGARGLLKGALPVTALMGAFDFATAGGGIGNRSQAAVNGATFGLAGKLGWKSDDEKASKRVEESQKRINGLLAQAGGEAPKTTAQLRQQGAILASALGTMNGTSTQEKEQRADTQKRLDLLKQVVGQVDAEHRARARALRADRDQRSETRGAKAATSFSKAFDVMKTSRGPLGAMDYVSKQLTAKMAKMRPAGARVMAQNTLSWARSLAKGNPAMQSVVDNMTQGIKDRFSRMGKHVEIVNGQILTGSRSEWGDIRDAMAEPAEKARQRVSTAFTAMQEKALGSLQSMGFSKSAATKIIKGLEAGGDTARDAKQVAGARGNGTAGGQSRRLGTGPSGLGSSRNLAGAKGMRIAGAGLQDNVQVAPGHIAAPGELIVNRHTESRVDKALSKYGTSLGHEVAGEKRPHSAAEHAMGGRINYARTGDRVSGSGPVNVNDFNHVYPKHIGPKAGATQFTPDQVVAIAQSVGLPGRAFEQIAHGESNYFPGIQQPDPGDGMVGYGLWQMTPNAWGQGAAKKKMDALGGIPAMFNPIKNAIVARLLYQSAGNSVKPWYGTSFLTSGAGVGQLGKNRYAGLGGKDGTSGGGSGGGGAVSYEKVKAPKLKGGGAASALGNAAMGAYERGLNSRLAEAAATVKPAGGGGSGPGGGVPTEYSGVKGIGMFGGIPVAKWIIPQLNYARKHGWAGNITSGYRSHAHNVAQGRNYHSNHEDTQYPGGAVDFGGFIDAAGEANKQAFLHAVQGSPDFKEHPLFSTIDSFDQGHLSGKGNALGGRIDGGAGKSMSTPDFGGWHKDGGSMRVTRPTLIGAGENGDEDVHVVPKGKRLAARPSSGGGGSGPALQINIEKIEWHGHGDMREAVEAAIAEEFEDLARDLKALRAGGGKGKD